MPDKTTDRIPGWQGAEGARGLGADLRARREELGWALPDVAGWLRIRESYLVALEEGNMSVFPGSAYALGFLRTYAHALGMDPDDAVARFRRDTRGALDRKTELSFPEPVSERGVPVGLWVGAGLAVLVGTYIGYYHFFGSEPAPTHQMPSVAEIMPGVTQHGTPSPQIAAVMPDRGLAPSPQSPAEGPAATQAPALPGTGYAGTAASNASPAGRQDQTPGSAPLPGQISSPAILPASENASHTMADGAVPAGQASSQASAEQTGAEQAGAGQTGAGQTVAGLNTATPGAGVPGSPAGQTGAVQSGAVMPSMLGASPAAGGPPVAANMIALHAGADAWVSIRDRNGATVFSRVLKAGETWQGPDDAAPYRMTLGNAGGLTLSAGDVTTSALGRVGAVRRNLVVSASAIRDGQLGQEGSAAPMPALTAAPVAPVPQSDAAGQTNDGSALKTGAVVPKVTASPRHATVPGNTEHEFETDRLNASQLERTAHPH